MSLQTISGFCICAFIAYGTVHSFWFKQASEPPNYISSSSSDSVNSLSSSFCRDSLLKLVSTAIFTPSDELVKGIVGVSGEIGTGELIGKLARGSRLENSWSSFLVSSRIGSVREVVGSAG